MTALVAPLPVRHRLALGIEPLDTQSGRLVRTRLSVGIEGPGCQPGRAAGEPGGRYLVLHDRPLPGRVLVLVDDPHRQHAPRRLDVALWRLAEVAAAEATPAGRYVPAASRLLRPWLLPGSAYPAPRGSTGVRGRVEHAGQPASWARVTARHAGRVVARAHADDRGEFLLLVPATGDGLAASGELDLKLVLHGSATAPSPGRSQAAGPAPVEPVGAAFDRLADLPVEPVERSAVPPRPSDLDSPLLRGEVVPAGYVVSSLPPPLVAVPVGEVVQLSAPLPFVP